MENTKKILLAAALIISVQSASAQTYVHNRPHHAEVTRGVAPSPQHVWIDEDWHAKKGKYQFRGGHYAKPPHKGYKYSEGHWDHTPHGDSWKSGNWHR